MGGPLCVSLNMTDINTYQFNKNKVVPYRREIIIGLHTRRELLQTIC